MLVIMLALEFATHALNLFCKNLTISQTLYAKIVTRLGIVLKLWTALKMWDYLVRDAGTKIGLYAGL